jgi:hypothetical protein
MINNMADHYGVKYSKAI